MKRLIRIATVVGLFGLLSVGAFAAAPAAFAERTYECGSCANIAGPDEYPINDVWGENQSGKGLCVTMWRDNGGVYSEVKKYCTSSGINGIVEGETVTGHGDTKRWYECCTYHLWGWQHFV